MKSYLQRHLRAFFFVAGFTILMWMVWTAGPSVLWHHMMRLGWVTLALVAVIGVVYLLNASAWAAIIGAWPLKKRLSPSTIFQCTVSGYSINMLTPFGLLGGEPYRVMRLKPYMGLEAATSSVTLYAMMHMCSHFIFWLVACVVALFVIPDISVTLSVVLGSMLALSVFLIFLFSKLFRGYHQGMAQVATSHLSHFPFVGRKVAAWREANLERLASIDAGIISLLRQHPGRFCYSLGMEFFSRIVGCLEYWLVLWQLGYGDSASFAAAYVIVAFSSLFANLLFFSPLQMGTREGGILLSLQALGIAGAGLPVAISISFATRVREFIWIGIGLLMTLFVKKQK